MYDFETDREVGNKALLASYLDHPPLGAVLCPVCGGGRSKERSFKLRHDAAGRLVGICFRASCNYRYKSAQIDVRTIGAAANDDVCTAEYFGDIMELPDDEIVWWRKRYNFYPHFNWVEYNGELRYVLPIHGPASTKRRGVVLRAPHSGSTLLNGGNPPAPKTLTYRETAEPLLAWYMAGSAAVIVCEDQISAMKVAIRGAYTSVALLGTQLTADKVAELQQYSRHIVLALDPDATALAFRHARRWGSAFETCRVLVLQKDIKDDLQDTWLDSLYRLAPPSDVAPETAR